MITATLAPPPAISYNIRMDDKKNNPHPHLEQAARLQDRGVFLGSPLHLFDAGRLSLMALLHAGLYPNHRVLEIGCGALRSGYWLIHFLNKGSYYGIEPNKNMLSGGLLFICPAGLVLFGEGKAPRFNHNDQFDAGVFGETKFDFFLCCSIWSHAAKPQIEIMLDQFVAHSCPEGKFLTSYIPAITKNEDYQGITWVGRSHLSDTKGSVRHSLNWIRAACALRGLDVHELSDIYNFSNQTWLMIEKG